MIDNGGPAFPVITSEVFDRGNHKQEVVFHTSEGMSLLDYVAIEVLKAHISLYGLSKVNIEDTSETAYSYAQQFIEEKRKLEKN